MANGNSLFTFIAGVATGVGLYILSKTEKGEEVVETIKQKGSEAFENGREAVLRGLDKIEYAISSRGEGKPADKASEE